MTDLQLIYLILGLIYAWECAFWLPSGSIAFRTLAGKRWKPTIPGALLGNQEGGFVFAHLFPPLGALVQTAVAFFSISPAGILAYNSQHPFSSSRPYQSGEWCAFEQMKTLEPRGKWLCVNGRRFVRARSVHAACKLARWIESLKAAPRLERESMIRKFVADSFDVNSARKRLSLVTRRTRGLRWVTNILWCYVFAVSPAALWFIGLKLTWVGLLSGLLLLILMTAVMFHRVHRELLPELEDERFTQFIIVLLSPANSIRALDPIFRWALDQYHPVAVGAVVLEPAAFTNLAGRCLRDLKYPTLPGFASDIPEAVEAEHWFRKLNLEALEAFLHETNSNALKSAEAPPALDLECASFCPRCLTQFTAEANTCADCGGLPLMAAARQPGNSADPTLG